MKIREAIPLKLASIEALEFTPATEPKGVLVISVDCTPTIAQILSRGWVYQAGTSVPQEGLTKAPLGDVEIDSAQLLIPKADKTQTYDLRPDVITKFVVVRAEEDVKLRLHMRVHFTGYFHDLVEIFMTWNKEEFTAELRPLQGELFDADNTVKVEASGSEAGVNPVAAVASKAEVQGIDYKKGRRKRGEAPGPKNLCVACGEPADRVDDDGQRYCSDHFAVRATMGDEDSQYDPLTADVAESEAE